MKVLTSSLNINYTNILKSISFKESNSTLIGENTKIFNNKDNNLYIYSFFLKKNFTKKTKLTQKIKKNTSVQNILLFLQMCVNSGNKLKTLNVLNKVFFKFYLLFKKKTNFLQKRFSNYGIFYNFSKSEKKF